MFLRLGIFLYLLAFSVSAQSSMSRLFTAAKQFEIQTMPKPSWAELETPVLFRAAWLSDLHITDETSEALVRQACEQVSADLKVDFTFISGDNCGLPATALQDIVGESLDLRRQLWLKDFLDRHLPGGYEIIPGDNWPWAFERVFGAEKKSFSYAGFRFIFFTPDEQAPAQEGCLVYADDSLHWLEGQLRSNQRCPTVVITHEPLYPPCFLDAPRLQQALAEQSQVLAVFSGHLHLDLEFKATAHWQQFCAPAIGRSHRPGFKLLSFTGDKILLESYEWQEEANRFVAVDKWQKVDIPAELQVGLPTMRPEGGFIKQDIQGMPARERRKNTALGARAAELSSMSMAFVLQLMLGGFLRK